LEAVTERPERTAQGYRRFRCRVCGKQFNERSGGLLIDKHQMPFDLHRLDVGQRHPALRLRGSA
jgi:hypothetical protein